MGSLYGVWLDVPDNLSCPEDLTRRFAAFFGLPWSAVMLGREEDFNLHKDWSAYVAVSGLAGGPGRPLGGLTGVVPRPEEGVIYRVMAG